MLPSYVNKVVTRQYREHLWSVLGTANYLEEGIFNSTMVNLVIIIIIIELAIVINYMVASLVFLKTELKLQ